MCMCRSTSISGGRASRVRDRRRCARVSWRRATSLVVDRLELVGDARPAERGAQLPAPAPQPRRAAPGSSISRVRCAASVCASPGSNSSPCSPSAEQLLVGRQPRGDRHDAAGERAHEHARRRPHPLGGEHDARRRRPAPRPRRASADRRTDPLAQRPAERRRRRERPRRPHRRAPVERRRGSAPQRAQEHAQRGALLLGDHQQLRRARAPSCAGGCGVGARRDHPVVAREEALHQLAGGARSWRCGRRAGRTAAATAGRVSWVERIRSVGCVEAADVQRARVAQRDARGARRERLVHVDDVERQRCRAPPRSCARRRPAARRRAAAWARTAAPRRRRAPAARRRRARAAPRARLRSARRLSRTSAPDSDGAMTSTRCPRRDSSSETRAT